MKYFITNELLILQVQVWLQLTDRMKRAIKLFTL